MTNDKTIVATYYSPSILYPSTHNAALLAARWTRSALRSQRTGILPARSRWRIARHRHHDNGEITRLVITAVNHALMHRSIMFASRLPLGTSHTPGMLRSHRRPTQIIPALLADLLRSFLLWSSSLTEFMACRGRNGFRTLLPHCPRKPVD
ncbi:hypothetical protein BKA82DRAFT_4179477 [Pisolithus tinctorius]|nr:hypothetical protein BKA82DRAFT_4179477 [Pisolithus tinctorius]